MGLHRQGMKKGRVDLISSKTEVDMLTEAERSEKIFEVIKILMEFGEKELAFKLRVAHDTHLRLGWKKTN